MVKRGQNILAEGVAPSRILGVYNLFIYKRILTLFLGFGFCLSFFWAFSNPPNLHRTKHFLDLEIEDDRSSLRCVEIIYSIEERPMGVAGM